MCRYRLLCGCSQALTHWEALASKVGSLNCETNGFQTSKLKPAGEGNPRIALSMQSAHDAGHELRGNRKNQEAARCIARGFHNPRGVQSGRGISNAHLMTKVQLNGAMRKPSSRKDWRVLLIWDGLNSHRLSSPLPQFGDVRLEILNRKPRVTDHPASHVCPIGEERCQRIGIGGNVSIGIVVITNRVLILWHAPFFTLNQYMSK